MKKYISIILLLLAMLLFVGTSYASFSASGFRLIGKSESQGQNIYGYTTADSKATIKGASYFNNVAPYKLKEGDIIIVTSDNDGTIGTMTVVVGDVTSGVVTITESTPATHRIPIPLASVFVDGTGPITSSSAPNLATTDNVAAITWDNSGETAEIQFPWFPDTYFTGLTVNLICTSSVATGSQQAVDWGIWVHGDGVTIPSVIGQTGATLTSTTLNTKEELVTLTLDATGIAAITAGTSGVDIAIWNNGTSAGTLEIKQIYLEETR